MADSAALLDRLSDKFTVDDGCWEWTAYRNPKGYGILGATGRKGKSTLAHRVLWELFNGPIPDGTEIDHLCRNRGCVRPAHLEAVSHRENLMRSPRWQVTHCPRGHEYDEANTYWNGKKRACRACHNQRGR